MNLMYDKIIVTNRKRLLSKYGNEGFKTISQALTVLGNADKRRGISSNIVYLDDSADMKKVRGKAVTDALDPLQNKKAIDSVFKFYNPHYLMILGAPDVLPHQDLDNPAREDGDDHAWSDLPYACDAPYSQDPARFVGPTRVVGRLPDLFGANESSYLISLLKVATEYKMRSPDDYMLYLGLSAGIWQGSTQLSLYNIFGNADKLLIAPPSGPNYPNGELRNRMHFINCHGGEAKPAFYGQRDKNDQSFPESLTTQSTNGTIVEGTVAAVECCYGAELYDSITLGIDIPICQSYLQQGAYGYFGSTTIAYGPDNTNAEADLICQYFLLKVFEGASLGHAALMARQLFVRDNAQMDPFNLKTLAQYCLLGDPSVHPITVQSATGIPTGVAKADSDRFFRAERRQKMKLAGDFLMHTKPTASKRAAARKLPKTTVGTLSEITKSVRLPEKQTFIAYAVKGAQGAKGRVAKARTAPLRYLVTIGTPEEDSTEKVHRGVAVVAKELGGRIMGYRIYQQR
jgi:hypothetical protein